MECKYHPGQEADLVCLKCSQPFCRECVKETRESHYCPDCHKETVERLASQMAVRSGAKPARVKEPKPPKEKKEDKKLRRPAEAPLPPSVADLVPPPPAPEPPAPSLSAEEKAAFWGDSLDDVASSPVEGSPPRTAEPAAPPEPAQPVITRAGPSKTAAARPDPARSQPGRIEGLPPPLTDAAPVGVKKKKVEKRPIPGKEEREQAVMTAEGFPTGARGAIRAVEDPAAETAKLKKRTRRRGRRMPDLPVAMQVPDDYDGEVTSDPTYFKAILFGMAVGLVGAAIYATVAWWLHKDIGIFAWVIGAAVGFLVSFGSGRHYNWKLGLSAALIAMFWVSAARIVYYMLDVRFNKIFPMKLGIWPLFRNSVEMFASRSELLSLWLAFLIGAGLVAFVFAFRPPPIRLQIDQGGPRRVANKKA